MIKIRAHDDLLILAVSPIVVGAWPFSFTVDEVRFESNELKIALARCPPAYRLSTMTNANGSTCR